MTRGANNGKPVFDAIAAAKTRPLSSLYFPCRDVKAVLAHPRLIYSDKTTAAGPANGQGD
jgi:hypothetical protein